MTTSCAAWRPISGVEPPRLSLPEAAVRPCELARLPDRPTLGDLEAAYMIRGAQLVTCDAARQLAIDTLLAERAVQDRWRGNAGRPIPGPWRRPARQNPPGAPANPAA